MTNSKHSADVIIVGGGINGLVLAYEFARRGASVILLDRRDAGKEASWAGGGLLFPLGPWRYSDAVQKIAVEAAQYYPIWLEELKQYSSIDTQLRRSGIVMVNVACEPDFYRWRQNQASLSLLSACDLQTFSFLNEHFCDGWWLPEVNQVRNPLLLLALKESIKQLGVTIMEWCEVRHFTSTDSKIRSVISSNGVFFANKIIIAAGPWSRGLLQKMSMDFCIQPVLGQMLRVLGPHHFSTVLMEHRSYLIPRADGSVLLGSTTEHVGFRKICTVKARKNLIEWAARWWPGVSNQWVTHHWCGLRPAAPGGEPFVGRVKPFDNLWISSGHFRNGLLMAPLMANRLVNDIELNQQII